MSVIGINKIIGNFLFTDCLFYNKILLFQSIIQSDFGCQAELGNQTIMCRQIPASDGLLRQVGRLDATAADLPPIFPL